MAPGLAPGAMAHVGAARRRRVPRSGTGREPGCFPVTREAGLWAWGGRREVPGGNLEPGRVFLGPGFLGFPPAVLTFAFDLDFDFWVGGGVESLFLTSPPLSLFEGVRSENAGKRTESPRLAATRRMLGASMRTVPGHPGTWSDRPLYCTVRP